MHIPLELGSLLIESDPADQNPAIGERSHQAIEWDTLCCCASCSWYIGMLVAYLVNLDAKPLKQGLFKLER
jgi:hypothetical protein